MHSHVNRLRRIALAATVFAEIKLTQVNIFSHLVSGTLLMSFRMILPRPLRAFYRRIDYGIVLSVRCLTLALRKAPRKVPPFCPIPSMCLQTAERPRRRGMTTSLPLVLTLNYIMLARRRMAWNGKSPRVCSRRLCPSQTSIFNVDRFGRLSISYESPNDSPDR